MTPAPKFYIHKYQEQFTYNSTPVFGVVPSSETAEKSKMTMVGVYCLSSICPHSIMDLLRKRVVLGKELSERVLRPSETVLWGTSRYFELMMSMGGDAAHHNEEMNHSLLGAVVVAAYFTHELSKSIELPNGFALRSALLELARSDLD